MTFTIHQSGKRPRPACSECHRVNVKFRRGDVCVECRAKAWAEEIRYRRRMNRMFGDNFYKIPRVKRKRTA